MRQIARMQRNYGRAVQLDGDPRVNRAITRTYIGLSVTGRGTNRYIPDNYELVSRSAVRSGIGGGK